MKILVLLSLIFLPASNAWADTVIVENHVSSSANTGGNSASSGEIVNGVSTVDVQIKTVVNGEVIEDLKIHETKPASPAGGSSGTPIVIDKKFEIIATSSNATSSTNVKVEINNSSSTSKKANINKKIINNLTATNSQEQNVENYEIKKINIFKKIYQRFLSIFKFF